MKEKKKRKVGKECNLIDNIFVCLIVVVVVALVDTFLFFFVFFTTATDILI